VARPGVNDLFTNDDAATPISEDEKAGLIPQHITLQVELNEYEARGIAEADAWLRRRRHNLLEQKFVRALHKRMFRTVWTWAGSYRTTGKNIGIDAALIPAHIKLLLDDTKYWIEHATFSPDEICIRFHHRLVLVHPFANGNGRHARLMTDALIVQLGRPRFTWGGAHLTAKGDDRDAYVAALKAADRDPNDIGSLLSFARS
jgi:Fic-DOC domain mobile mystery protein B